MCTVRVWKAGGWHAHVRHPDGMWDHIVWPAANWWAVDAHIADLQQRYGRENVEVV